MKSTVRVWSRRGCDVDRPKDRVAAPPRAPLKTPRTIQLAKPRRRRGRVGAGTSWTVQLANQRRRRGRVGAGTWDPVDDEATRPFTTGHGVTANPPLDIRHWGWAKRDKEFCGELSGRWECFFLPWNRCDAHKLTEEIAAKAKQRLAGSLDNITKQRDEETLLVSQLLLTDERGWLGKAVIRPGAGGVLQRCGSNFKCDSINSARQGGQLNARTPCLNQRVASTPRSRR